MTQVTRESSSRASSSGRRSAYRRVSRQSEVDETLFGNTKPGARPAAKGRSQMETINASATGSPGQTDSVVITARDLKRMKAPSMILTAQQVSAQRKAAEAERQKARVASDARKERMLRMEEERKKALPKSESEQLKAAEDQTTLSQADLLMQEEKDEVKRMNQMVLYSKCVTIRDAQIAEKEYIAQEREEEERRLDMQYELDRIKGLQAYEQREIKRAVDRKKGADVLRKQIEEREKDRLKEEEMQDQEREQMLREIERMKMEETEKSSIKRDAGKKLLADVAAANAQQIERKKLIKQAEAEEDANILRYIKERERKEHEQAAEKARISKEKELEVARMRQWQEKAADKQAEIDELRAKRAQEAYEREWRQKEMRESQRKERINAELAEAREAQKQHKTQQLAIMAKMEQEDFKRIIAVHQQKEREDEVLEHKSLMTRQKHKDDLLAQIAKIEENRKKERREYLAEGDRLRKEHASELNRLEGIKSRKLGELEAAGVPAKYRAELERKRVAI